MRSMLVDYGTDPEDARAEVRTCDEEIQELLANKEDALHYVKKYEKELEMGELG